MQLSTLITFIACSVFANAAIQGNITTGGNETWVTDIVTEFTTFCPASTTFEAYGNTYTVTEATTLTLPCPCTSSYAVASSAPTIPVVYSTAPIAAAPSYVNATTPVVYTEVASTSPVSVGTAAATTTLVATTAAAASSTTSAAFTGAATRNVAAGGLVGLAAFAAYVL